MTYFSARCLHADMFRFCVHGTAGICIGELYIFWQESKNSKKETERITEAKRTRKGRTEETNDQSKFDQPKLVKFSYYGTFKRILVTVGR